MKRTLSLTRETLAELSDGDLAGVAGGQDISGLTCPLLDCLSGGIVCQLTEQPRCF